MEANGRNKGTGFLIEIGQNNTQDEDHKKTIETAMDKSKEETAKKNSSFYSKPSSQRRKDKTPKEEFFKDWSKNRSREERKTQKKWRSHL